MMIMDGMRVMKWECPCWDRRRRGVRMYLLCLRKRPRRRRKRGGMGVRREGVKGRHLGVGRRMGMRVVRRYVVNGLAYRCLLNVG
jgi:hypothetical protein